MSLSLPYDVTLDGGVISAHVQANFAVLAAKFGALVAADMPSLVLPTSQLTASNCEVDLCLAFDGTIASSATAPLRLMMLPNVAGYTVTGCTYGYVCTSGTSAGLGSISVNIGTIVASAFNSTQVLVASTSLGSAASGNASFGALSLSSSSFTGPVGIALLGTAAGTNAVRLQVNVQLKRGLQ